MAESYRGLTIQIGGDTTKLTKALHTADQAASGTQSTLKKLSDALKLDPTSLKASQLQVGAFASQAANAATRLTTVNEAMRQISNEVKTFNGSTATVKQLADSWGNVNMTVSQTRDYYNALTKSLATNYTEFSKLYSEASKMASVKMTDGWELGTTSIDTMLSKVKEVGAAFGANKNQVTSFTSKISSLQERYDKLAEKYKEYQAAVATETDSKKFVEMAQNLEATRQKMVGLKQTFQEYIASFNGFDSKKLFKYDSDNTSLESLAKTLYQMVQTNAVTIEQADRMYDSFENMKNMWKDAFENVQTANVVEGMKDLEAEAAKAEAKVASLVNKLVEAARMDATQGIAKLEERLSAVSEASSAAGTRLKQALSVIRDSFESGTNGPTGGQMTDAMRSYADNVEYAKAKVELLEQEILKLGENEAVANLAGSTNSLVAESQEAEQSYNDMAEAVTKYEAALHAIEDEQKAIKKDNDKYEDDERYQELAKQASAFHEILKVTYASADTAKQKFAEMTQALTLREKLHDLEMARAELQKLQDMKLKPEIDVSALDGIKRAIESMSDITLNADGMSEFRDNVKRTAEAMSDAEKRYKALADASKKDPTNAETMRLKTEAFNQVVEATNEHIKAMRAEMEAIPSDRIDKAALAAGTAEENYRNAQAEVNKYKTALIDINKRIDDITKNRKSILEGTMKSEDVLLVNKLTRELEELKQRRDALAATGDAAFDNLVVAENTRRIQEHMVAIQQDEASIVSLGKAADDTSKKTATPKVDEAAFMQVVSRIAQAARQMGQEIVQSSNEIDSAYRNMRKTVQGTEEDFERLRNAAIEYSQSSITSADQMLEMQALGGQLGVATENLEQFGKIASTLDIATDINAEDVALKLGQISNVLGLDIEGMQGFADALVRLGNNMPAQESAIMAVAQRFGAVASTAKFSGDEILAWSASIAATGQRSEAAATAISNTVSGIEQAVANGGADLKQFAAIAGMSSEQFVAAWKDSPTEVLRSFIKGLETLKDSDESAVAALENMGITGVRQQQTLLALTQTIDELDKALAMSSDAWNQIDDQWGNAGDAANEAARKSEGFSGALAILQNNAQNLAASFGDSLVPLMNDVSNVIAFITDVFNNLPEPFKRVIVEVGGLTVAFSTLVPMLQVFNKGITGTIAAIKGATSIGAAADAIMGIGTAGTAAAEGVTVLSGAMTGGLTLAIGAAVAAIVYGISKINEYNEAQKTLHDATIGLTSAMEEGKAAYDTYVSNAQSATRSTEELRDAIVEATEAQAAYAASLQEDWDGISKSEAQIDTLIDEITTLALKSKLSAEEQAKLCGDIKAFNALTGESVHVLDAQNGTLDTNVKQIKEMGKEWKGALEQDQLFNQYVDEVSQITEAEQLLKEAQDKLQLYESDHWFKDMSNGAISLTDDYASLKNEVNQYANTLSYLKSEHQQTINDMSGMNLGLGEIEVALQANGRSLTEYGQFTDEELEQVEQAWKDAGAGSAEAIRAVMDLLDQFISGGNDAAAIASQLEESSKAFYKAAAETYKADAKVVYNQTKADLDAAYKAKQREYNAEYKALQKSLDANYKAQQKAYDKEYKALQKSLDKQYDALKDKLDDEYDARKAAYDAQLKALKKQQEAEVDAFNKATDAKLKAMEREYKERLRLLELEYGGKSDDIDEKINALNAETEAEKKAIEEREENEKTAELQKAVTQAKSRRKRAEAEKALNDYLEELQQKHNETERKAQIEALKEQQQDLKDELAERKEALKEQYDADVEAYKTSRAEQLDAIKEANAAEYDAEKARLDKLLKELKDAQADRLKGLKESQQDQLDALKESQQAQLDSLKDNQQAQLDALKESQSVALENLKASQTQQLQELKASQDAKYKAIKNGEDEQTNAQYAAGKKNEQNQKSANSSMEREQDAHAQRMFDRTNRMLTEMDKDYGYYGEKAPETFSAALDAGSGMVSQAMKRIKAVASYPLEDLGTESHTWGYDMLTGFNNGFVEAWAKGFLMDNVRNVAQSMKNILGFSVPKEGPMSDADKWGPDMVKLIADGIRDEQNTLVHQVRKMSEAMEEAFDPTLSVDAAFEALDTIGKNRGRTLEVLADGKAAQNITVNLNMNLSGVSIREDADIERLAKAMSQEMASQAARQLAGRLG